MWLGISKPIIVCQPAKIKLNENSVGSSQVAAFADQTDRENDLNNNYNNNIYLLQLGWYPVVLIILHVNKT